MTELHGRERFLLLYGSQTGQAQAIAEQIRERSLARGFDPDLYCLDQAEKKFFLEKEPVFVVVVSSTGDGDPPDNTLKFWRKLRRKTLPKDHLASCKFALLGLGDTNYTNFCNMGKKLNKRLLELGASSFHPPGFADDGVGLEIVVEPWIDDLWSPLSSVLRSSLKTDSIPLDTELKTLSSVTAEDSALGEQKSPNVRSGAVGLEESEGVNKGGKKEVNEGRKKEVNEGGKKEVNEGGNKEVNEGGKKEVNEGVNKVNEGEISRRGIDEVDDILLTESIAVDVVNPPQNISQSEVAVMPRPALRAGEEFHGDGGQSKGKESDTAAAGSASEEASSLLSGTFQNLVLSDSSLIDPPAKVEGQDDVCMSTDHTIDDSCDQALVTALRTRLTGLTGCTLGLPSSTHAYLQVVLTENLGVSKEAEPIFPFDSISYGYTTVPISMATIVGSRLLTKEGSHKKTMELQLEVPGLAYQPGDAFGFVCPNNRTEVHWLVERLGLTSEADKMMELSVMSGTSKRNAALPKHVPRCCSVYQFFTHCADIRTVPKKAFLRLLSAFCSDDDDSERLLELSSRQGAMDYSTLFTELRTDFLDVLHFFPSCHPPLERLIELLPRLQPRYYSATRVMEVLRAEGARYRLAGGGSIVSAEDSIQKKGDLMYTVPIFPRNSNPFRMPADGSHSIVMIGPGTGVSPFMGFLESREQRLGPQRQSAVGKAWLFFGCRHPDTDHIYKEEMDHFARVGCLTHLHVAYSRVSPTLGQAATLVDPVPLRYVQDLMQLHWEELGAWIVEDKAYVFVCGDAKNMAKDVRGALLDVLERFLQATCPDDNQEKLKAQASCPDDSQEKSSTSTPAKLAEHMVCKMKEEGRYLVDAWSAADVDDESLTFAPTFTHQVFGEKETIFGYKNLKIKLYYTPDTLQTYLGLTYDQKVEPAKHDGIKPDNVFKILSEFLPTGYSVRIDEFLARASKTQDFQPFGDLLHAYSRDGHTYEVYKADMSCSGFREYHERLQTFLLWFVDAVSFIDVDDDKWMYYIMLEKRHVAGKLLYSTIGYTTVYSFYAYPDKVRPRLSQMLILPPFQRKGHGAHLLQSVYDDLIPNPKVVDITIEDPSEEFCALRDFVDCQNALKLRSFRPPAVHRPYAESAEAECRAKLKLQKRQALHVYEILRLQATNRSDLEQYKEYRLAVKNRVNGPYQKEQKYVKKLQNIMDPTELAMTHPQISHDEHVMQLDQTYKMLEEDYLKILRKLASSPEI